MSGQISLTFVQSSERVATSSKAAESEVGSEPPAPTVPTQESTAGADTASRRPTEKYWSINEKAKEAMQQVRAAGLALLSTFFQEGKRVTRGEVRRILAPPPPSGEAAEPKGTSPAFPNRCVPIRILMLFFRAQETEEAR